MHGEAAPLHPPMAGREESRCLDGEGHDAPRAPTGVSSLHVRLNADELRRCRSCSSRPPHLKSGESEGGNGEIIDDSGGGESKGFSPNAIVQTADKKLIVLSSSVPHCPDICFYVVYEAAETSLSMIPHLPSNCRPTFHAAASPRAPPWRRRRWWWLHLGPHGERLGV